MNRVRRLTDFATPTTALLAIVLHIFVVACFLLFVLENELLSSAFISTEWQELLIQKLGGEFHQRPDGPEVIAPLSGVLGFALCWIVLKNIVSWLSCLGSSTDSPKDLPFLILQNAAGSLPLFLWELLWLAGLFSSWCTVLAAGTVNIAAAAMLAIWFSQLLLRIFAEQSPTSQEESNRISRPLLLVCLGVISYTVILTAMNWGLWFNLRLPHGDSSMYEEHLWNFTRGKGFRSYLDQGLFLGEHIQVIHLFLTPLYLIWPSHLLLELSESTALALGAIPTFLIARRHSHNEFSAACVAFAYLLYFPLHYLDIAIDLKTFRPISFGVPIMLWAINALEQKQWKQMTIAFLLALACKEDFAIIIAPLGLWCLWNEWISSRKQKEPADRKTLMIGGMTALLATAYLLLVVKFAIPWFRNWETVHYARYFEEFGKTPTEIVITMMTRPQLLFSQLLTFAGFLFVLRTLFPLGMPIRGWTQLLVGTPLLVLLLLNNIAMQPPVGPYHHFHAPLVPIVVWAACAAVADGTSSKLTRKRGSWILGCALATTILFSFLPLSLRFWDPGQEMYWKKQYIPDDRARAFENVITQIPQDAIVASTDYVHPRLTHYKKSYDYSDYPRAVANYEDKVPDDTEYIVLDRKHKHSTGKFEDLSNIRELKNEPDRWEVLDDRTGGYFIILKRKSPGDQ